MQTQHVQWPDIPQNKRLNHPYSRGIHALPIHIT